jgi:hypothetical protein
MGEPIDASVTDSAVDDASSDAADASGACPVAPLGGTFPLVATSGAKTDLPAATHPDLNVKVRGFVATGDVLGLVDVGGAADPKAPRLYTLVQDTSPPTLVANFQVNQWDWTGMKVSGPITSPAVTMTAYATTVGQPIRLARSGYTIASGLSARVLYLDGDSITLKYTLEDNVVSGYTIHVLDLCIETELTKAYQTADAGGRSSLPALASLQPFARARGTSVRVVIRDTGSFMDPRVRKDWYQP